MQSISCGFIHWKQMITEHTTVVIIQPTFGYFISKRNKIMLRRYYTLTIFSAILRMISKWSQFLMKGKWCNRQLLGSVTSNYW
jgi:hypothetical protein